MVIPGVLYVERPRTVPVPLVVDSPHSGTAYPEDFDCVAPMQAVRRAEDTYVDELYADAPDLGVHLQAALFPRSYIDPNRSLADLDPDLLEEPWPEPLNPSEKTRLGHGLIWRVCPPDHRMYDRKLRIAEVRRRIDAYWQPYHDTLGRILEETYGQFGCLWHLNCHSMPSISTPDSPERLNGRRRADFVLGDRDGTTCEPAFIDLVRRTLTGYGYNVVVNDPYKGVELVRAHSDPARNRHSLQIEINRAIYMDEVTFQRTAGFEPLRRHLKALMVRIADYARERIDRLPA